MRILYATDGSEGSTAAARMLPELPPAVGQCRSTATTTRRCAWCCRSYRSRYQWGRTWRNGYRLLP